MIGGSFNYEGFATVVAAVGAAAATVISAFNHKGVNEVNRKVDTNGDPREIGQIASDMAKTVSPSPEPATAPDVPPGE